MAQTKVFLETGVKRSSLQAFVSYSCFKHYFTFSGIIEYRVSVNIRVQVQEVRCKIGSEVSVFLKGEKNIECNIRDKQL